jgi:hypothetical protein
MLAGLCACQAPERSAESGPAPSVQASVYDDARTILAVPHIQQETLLCVPTSAAMILAFYGDPQPPRRLKVLASGGAYNPAAAFNDFSITYYRDLIRGLQTLGYSWMERSYPETEAGFTEGIGLIESEIRNGRPVMIDISAPDGHTIVVSGFDTNARQVFVVDPNRPAPGSRWMSYGELQSLWNEHGMGGNFRSLVTTRPK